MNLKVLLPFQVFANVSGVTRIVAESIHGSFGLLQNRLDCAAALVPGILVYETPAAGTVYVAVDGGILVKTGGDVLVSVRRAMGGANLSALHQAVKQQFSVLDSQQREVRAAVVKMEGSLIGRLVEFGQADRGR
jgi:F-type H+-transporting ATPase subunit epsilon